MQGAFVLGAGAVQVAQGPQQAAEAVAPGADGGVVGSEGGLADLQGAFVLGANRTLIARRAWDNASSGCPSLRVVVDLRKSHHPSSEGHSCVMTRSYQHISPVDPG